MPNVSKILAHMRTHPSDMSFRDAKKVCDFYFGDARRNGSHHIYRTPWPGDPRVNIQDRNGRIAGYQIIQIVDAIDKLEETDG